MVYLDYVSKGFLSTAVRGGATVCAETREV